MEAKQAKDNTWRELEAAKKKLNTDYGADAAFYGLIGATLEFADKEYTYKLNAFNDVLQTKPGHSSNLGRWKAWAGKNVMLFDGGDRCWGSPDRSTRVTVICGAENQLIDVQEPNKCEYTMKLRTPAACSQEALDALRVGA